MQLTPEDFDPLGEVLKAFAHQYEYVVEYIDHDGEQYFTVRWCTSNGWLAYLNLSPTYKQGEVPTRFRLGVHAFGTKVISTECTRGSVLGTFTIGDRLAFARKLEEGRKWAESLPRVRQHANVDGVDLPG